MEQLFNHQNQSESLKIKVYKSNSINKCVYKGLLSLGRTFFTSPILVNWGQNFKFRYVANIGPYKKAENYGIISISNGILKHRSKNRSPVGLTMIFGMKLYSLQSEETNETSSINFYTYCTIVHGLTRTIVGPMKQSGFEKNMPLRNTYTAHSLKQKFSEFPDFLTATLEQILK